MPAFCTHYLFMKDVNEKLKAEKGISISEGVAALATQGPDIFFFSRIVPIKMMGKPVRKVGTTLHRSKSADIFDAFNEYLKTSENKEAALSYIYGFIMHYALDRNCHPYVYAFQEKHSAGKKFVNPSSIHNEIEMYMDALFLHKKLGIDKPSDFVSADTLKDITDSEMDEVAKLLSYVSKNVIDIDLEEYKVKETIDDMIVVQGLLRNEDGKFGLLCRTLETILAPALKFFKASSMIKPKYWKSGEKYANIEKADWTSPYEPERVRNESFEELYDRAIDDAIELIEGFEAIRRGEANAKDVTNNLSFLTGCEVV